MCIRDRVCLATIIPTKPKHGGVENHGEILKLDLLGFDALPFEAGDRAVMLPVLNEDRLRKSILFEKSPERFADNEQMKLVMRLIKLKTMFILGAWAYEGLREATSILIDSTIQLLEMQSSETEDESVHTCLLYTSPSPRDRTRSRMPSSA